MSSIIWTRCAGEGEVRPLEARPWRVVEGQHLVSTRKLVDTDAEQVLLEELLEESKPAAVGGSLHYLLATPFRYPPLPRGSRFGHRHERGIWYGSLEKETAFGEAAYYRWLFLAGTKAALSPLEVDVTSFRAQVATRFGVDLRSEAFGLYRSRIASPRSYVSTQSLGRAMRAAGVEAFLWPSARTEGTNLGLFTPDAFSSKRPSSFEPWHCIATDEAVEYRRRDFFRHVVLRFERRDLLVAGELPSPAT